MTSLAAPIFTVSGGLEECVKQPDQGRGLRAALRRRFASQRAAETYCPLPANCRPWSRNQERGGELRHDQCKRDDYPG